MGESSIKIAVATHKPYRMPSDSMYIPLHVGAAVHPDVCNDLLGDDTGDNISWKNPFFCELTGLYWMWKNCSADYKGIVHYRRLFGSSDPKKAHARDPYDRLATSSELLSLLEGSRIVVAKRRRYFIETIYDHYAHTFEASHFDACRDVLLEAEPMYVEAWDRLMKSRSAHLFNMFVMSEDLFDSYCSFLFEVLSELEKKIDPMQYDSFGARYLGRVGECLLDPWLNTNELCCAELPVVSPEPVDWISKIKSFLLAKYFGKKYTRSF